MALLSLSLWYSRKIKSCSVAKIPKKNQRIIIIIIILLKASYWQMTVTIYIKRDLEVEKLNGMQPPLMPVVFMLWKHLSPIETTIVLR